MIILEKKIEINKIYKITELNDIFNKLKKKELNVIISHKNHDIFIQEDEEEEFDFNNTIKPLTKIEKEADGDEEEEEEEFDDKNTVQFGYRRDDIVSLLQSYGYTNFNLLAASDLLASVL